MKAYKREYWDVLDNRVQKGSQVRGCLAKRTRLDAGTWY